MWQVIAVGLGGAVGAIARFAVNGWSERRFPHFPPAGTLIVNVIGCLVIGIVMTIVHQRSWINREWQALIVTGFIGGLTTFSAYGYQSVELLLQQQTRLAALNVFANLVFGFGAVWLGHVLTRSCLK
jgi:fluoride exporter